MSSIDRAKKRIKAKKNFFDQLGAYVATSIVLIIINVFILKGKMWSIYPIGIWGAGLVFQAILLVFQDKTSRWEDKALRDEYRRLGYDPDLIDAELSLDELEYSKTYQTKGYKDSDLV